MARQNYSIFGIFRVIFQFKDPLTHQIQGVTEGGGGAGAPTVVNFLKGVVPTKTLDHAKIGWRGTDFNFST